MPKTAGRASSGAKAVSFAIPLNANYRIFNGSGTQPARYVAMTNLPSVLSLFHNVDFVFNNPFAFTDRFAGESDYFGGEGTLHRGRTLETNFISDVHSIQLHEWKERGGGGTNVMIELAQNSVMTPPLKQGASQATARATPTVCA